MTTRSVSLLLLIAGHLAAQTVTVPCEAPPETVRKLETLPPLRDEAFTYAQRVGALRELAQKSPGDFFVQRAYQDAFRRNNWLGDEYDRALAMYRKRGDVIGGYFEARLLMMSNPKPSRATLEQLLKEHPEFPWPHLDLAELATVPGSRTSSELAAHRDAFVAACPDAYVRTGAGVNFEAAVIRRALERRNSILDFGAWPALWAAEDRAAIPVEERQRRVRADLERIEALPFRADPDLVYPYREAARILKDDGPMQRLRAKVQHDAPGSTLDIQLDRDAWYAANPRPKYTGPDSQPAIQQYEEKKIAFERDLFRRHRNGASVIELWLPIMTAVNQQDPSVATSENLAVVDEMLRRRITAPDIGMEFPPREVGIAQVYVLGKVRLDQVPKLLDGAYTQIERQLKYATSSDLMPEEMRKQQIDQRMMGGQRVQQVRAAYLLAVNRPADARAVAEQALADLDRATHVTSGEAGRAQWDRQQWMELLGKIDSSEGRVEDALAHYQAAFPGVTRQMLDSPMLRFRLPPVKALYLAHGGTEEKWPEWVGSGKPEGPPPVARTVEFNTALPEFTAKDLAGRTWQLRDLTGKVTLVNFWATWCGPCRGEHVNLQKLYDAIKDRKDLQLLTISVDESPSAVPEYMKQQHYTFPVIHAPELADKLFPWAGLPTNFLVNAKGMRTGMFGVWDAESTLKRIEDATR